MGGGGCGVPKVGPRLRTRTGREAKPGQSDKLSRKATWRQVYRLQSKRLRQSADRLYQWVRCPVPRVRVPGALGAEIDLDACGQIG